MTDEPTDAEIAEALRALGETVHSTESSAEGRAAAIAHLQSAQELLGSGPPRLRWYEVDEGEVSEARSRTRELSAFSGRLNTVAPPMRISLETGAGGRREAVGLVRLGRQREGPPRTVHGGVIAGLFDELMGVGHQMTGSRPAVTGRLTIRYRHPTPVDADLEFRVWIEDERTRRVVMKGGCVVVGELLVTASAEAVFLRVDVGSLRLGTL